MNVFEISDSQSVKSQYKQSLFIEIYRCELGKLAQTGADELFFYY